MWRLIRDFAADCWLFLELELEMVLMFGMGIKMMVQPVVWLLVLTARLVLLNLPRLALRVMLRAGWPCAKPVYQALKCLTQRALKLLPRRP